MLADELLPQCDVESAHSISIDASPERVYEQARSLDMSGSWITRTLLFLRGMPPSGLSRDRLARSRFELLADVPGQGFALGLIGKFWMPHGGLLRFRPDDFVFFDEPGYAKAVWTFEVHEAGGLTLLRTRTRVRCTDDASRRSFKRYWRFVGPFSGLIRDDVLRGIKRKAEAS